MVNTGFTLNFQSTIDNAIKRAKNVDVVMVEAVNEIRGPGNTFIIIETFSKSVGQAQVEIKVLDRHVCIY